MRTIYTNLRNLSELSCHFKNASVNFENNIDRKARPCHRLWGRSPQTSCSAPPLSGLRNTASPTAAGRFQVFSFGVFLFNISIYTMCLWCNIINLIWILINIYNITLIHHLFLFTSFNYYGKNTFCWMKVSQKRFCKIWKHDCRKGLTLPSAVRSISSNILFRSSSLRSPKHNIPNSCRTFSP